LNSALFLGDANRVRALLEEDPHLHRVVFPGLLLDTALQRCSKELVELLLAHGVDPNKGVPPLFTATVMALNDPAGDIATIRLLLEHGADINQRSDGMSILELVGNFKSKNKRKVVALLKKHGAKE
jgi:ankyrin repeat protein